MTTERGFFQRLDTIPERMPEQLREQARNDIRLLTESSISSYEALLVAISNSSYSTEVRAIACWVLSRIGDAQSIPILIEAANDENTEIRRQAIQALGELKHRSPQVLEIIEQKLLNDSDVEVRKVAAYSYGLLATANESRTLLNVLINKTENPEVRGMAAEAISNTRDYSAIPILIDSLADTAPEVRYWSAFALGSIGNIDAVKALTQLSENDVVMLPQWGSVRDEAKRAIEAILARMQGGSS